MNNLRPQKLNEFIGKEKIKQVLTAMISGSIARKESLDHVLFIGNAGLGKTTLAGIIANELGKDIIYTIGNNIDDSLPHTLSNLEAGAVVFIDEIHRIPAIYQELLYPAMEDFKTFVSIGKGNFKTKYEINLNRFTLIGATTEAGLLTKPLHDRFGITLKLENYSLEEIKTIIKININKLSLDFIDIEAGAEEIGKRSRYTPRIANNLLKRVRDFATVQGGKITVDKVKDIFKILDIDESGLDNNDKKVLNVLNTHNFPLGITNISATCGIDRITIENVIEPFLLSEGLIIRTGRGRVITGKGKKILQ